MECRRIFRLDADDPDLWVEPFDIGGDPGDESAAADRDEDGVRRLRMLAQDLHADGALTGDDVRVVEGMNEGQTLLGHQLARMGIGFIIGIAVQHHLAAVGAHRTDLDRRRSTRHDDGRLESEPAGAERHALRMITSAGRDHATRTRLGIEMDQLVVGPAQFEGEHRLQVLAFEQHGIAQAGRESRRQREWSLDGDIIDARLEDAFDIGIGHAGSRVRLGMAQWYRIRRGGTSRHAWSPNLRPPSMESVTAKPERSIPRPNQVHHPRLRVRPHEPPTPSAFHLEAGSGA
jgi:hypothetical protein